MVLAVVAPVVVAAAMTERVVVVVDGSGTLEPTSTEGQLAAAQTIVGVLEGDLRAVHT